jgi:hypothetical protein
VAVSVRALDAGEDGAAGAGQVDHDLVGAVLAQPAAVASSSG